MPILLNDESLVSSWNAFFEKHYKGDIETIASNYPISRSLTVDYVSLDEKIASDLITQPHKIIFSAEQALKSFETAYGNLALHLRIKNMDQIFPCIPPNKLRTQQLGQFISVDGFVRKTTSVHPKLVVGAFQCQKCGATIRVEQNEATVKEPSECYEDQGGCGRVSTFSLLNNLSTVINYQKVLLQEPPEDIKQGEQAEKLEVHLEDDLVHSIVPGDRVVFSGILEMQPKRIGGKLSTLFNTFLAVNHVEIKHTAYSSMALSDEDIKEIKKLSKSEGVAEDICGSIAPSVFGYDNIKKAIMLQLFGSDSLIHKDGTFRRGDIHILLMGDPGIAKSVILEGAYLSSPRAIFVEGPLASGAGLTAVAIKDDFGEGQWTIEAGALPQADLGLAVIDEFEKMEPEDRNKIHRAMEQQKVTVTKAGLNVTLNARCAILAAANPKFGSFDLNESLMEQVDLPSTILSRFDTLFVMTDKTDKGKDKSLGLRIVHAYVDPESTAPLLSVELLKKYILYAKNNYHPVIPEALEEQIATFYSDLRNELANELTEAVTPRQIESVIRFSKATARLHLRNEVSTDDVNYAISVLESSYNTRLREDSKLNVTFETIETGKEKKSQIDKIKDVKEYCEKLKQQGNKITYENLCFNFDTDFIEKCKQQNILIPLPDGTYNFGG